MGLVTRNDVDQAYQLLKSAVAHTPLQYDRYLSEKYHATILLKREDLQKDSDIVVTQIRAIDNDRFMQKLASLSPKEMDKLKQLLNEIVS